jgi:Sigma-70 region 2
MASAALLEKARQEAWSDQQVVSRVLAGETALYELLMRRYNQRLYRVARAILHDDAEAEDVMQDAYVRAYPAPGGLRGAGKIFHMADSNCCSRSPGPLSPSFAVSVARKFGGTRWGRYEATHISRP